ncbi:hypothetical protein BC827DRAFT_383177 [Russula dissimulans]|nr:hypothetical protein BC827DRAFT_383177 [Russula dissimulans]
MLENEHVVRRRGCPVFHSRDNFLLPCSRTHPQTWFLESLSPLSFSEMNVICRYLPCGTFNVPRPLIRSANQVGSQNVSKAERRLLNAVATDNRLPNSPARNLYIGSSPESETFPHLITSDNTMWMQPSRSPLTLNVRKTSIPLAAVRGYTRRDT